MLQRQNTIFHFWDGSTTFKDMPHNPGMGWRHSKTILASAKKSKTKLFCDKPVIA
jgi:hypothetical protein